MICTSIGRGRHRHMIAEHRHLVETGAKLVELRLDWINGDVNLKRLLTDRPCPVIVACRREAEGGKWSGGEPQRLMLLRSAIAEGVDYIDLEEDVAASIPRFGKTKRIISYHNFRKTPDELQEIHDRLSTFDPDVVKIATMANHPHDNLRMLNLVRDSRQPTVGFCMGDMGAASRILCGRFGAPWTYATFHQERVLAPGQFSYQQMKDVFHYDQIDSATVVYGVIADPVGHSLSPQVHNAAFRAAGVNAVYVPFRVPAENLDQFLDEADQLGIHGLSVTIPHKETVLRKLAKFEPAVKGIGAANTIVFDGRVLIGYNTDYRAAMDALERAMQPPQYERGSIDGKTVLVLGAGGAARAIVFGLKRRNASVVVASRTSARAQQLADQMECRTVDWNGRHFVAADVVINCTPVGMHPNVDETPFEKHYLRPSMVVLDTVYNPENTLLVKDARSQSCTVITGVEMFIRQASLQFALFTGKDGPWELMRDVLKRAIGPAKM
jgi:3-dehydroquinate dehydratase/shikimate dehydrogenase